MEIDWDRKKKIIGPIVAFFESKIILPDRCGASFRQSTCKITKHAFMKWPKPLSTSKIAQSLISHALKGLGNQFFEPKNIF